MQGKNGRCYLRLFKYYMYICTYVRTYMHYITLHYITLHYTTLHYHTYNTLHYISWRPFLQWLTEMGCAPPKYQLSGWVEGSNPNYTSGSRAPDIMCIPGFRPALQSGVCFLGVFADGCLSLLMDVCHF